MAGLISGAVRPPDVTARLGGDEFAILLPESGAAEADATPQRLRSALVDALAATAVPVTGSIGIVTFVDVPDDIEDMVQRADAAMYRAKTGGKNRLWLELAPMEAERRV